MERFFEKEYIKSNPYIKVINPSIIKIPNSNIALKLLCIILCILVISITWMMIYNFMNVRLYNKDNYVKIENIHLLNMDSQKILKYHIVNFYEQDISFNKIKINFFDKNNKKIRTKVIMKSFFLNGKEILEFQEIFEENDVKHVKSINISIVDDIKIH